MRPPTFKELPPPPPGKTGWPWTKDRDHPPDTMSDGSCWPKISIVTPSYNQGQFLEETIRSVCHQDYPNLEYMIIDGGSTDNSIEIMRKYQSFLTYWISEPDAGQSDAINKGWRKSTGEIIAWLNADDYYSPGALSHVATIFRENPEVVLVHGSANTHDQSGRTLLFTTAPQDMDPYEMIAGCGGVTTQPSIFWRRVVLDEIGYLNPNLHYVMDWEYCIRIGLHFGTGRFRKTPVILSNNRDWPDTKTNTGWKDLCNEHRAVFDTIFTATDMTPRLEEIREAAYRSSFRRQADLARRHGARFEALRAVYKALRIGPFHHNPARECYLILLILAGSKYGEKIRAAIHPVTRRLDRHVGY